MNFITKEEYYNYRANFLNNALSEDVMLQHSMDEMFHNY